MSKFALLFYPAVNFQFERPAQARIHLADSLEKGSMPVFYLGMFISAQNECNIIKNVAELGVGHAEEKILFLHICWTHVNYDTSQMILWSDPLTGTGYDFKKTAFISWSRCSWRQTFLTLLIVFKTKIWWSFQCSNVQLMSICEDLVFISVLYLVRRSEYFNTSEIQAHSWAVSLTRSSTTYVS